MHEELRRTNLQVRVSDVHEILRQKVMRCRRLRKTKVRRLFVLALATFCLPLIHSGIAAATDAKKLSGAEIRTKLSGIQLTDEVHYRLVYERDGTLRSYSMGVKKVGKW